MATPAQAAAATVGAGSLAAAGAYGITQAVSGSEESTQEEAETDTNEPQNPTTFQLTSGVTTLESNYQNKILDITKRENLAFIVKGNDSNNKEWWKWAYKHKFLSKPQNTPLDPLFSKVNEDYSDTSDTALNKACEIAYKKEKTEYRGENKHIVSNIGSFCTKGSTKVDISEPRVTDYFTGTFDSYANGLLSVESNRAKLIKTKETANFNDLWWEWAFENIFSKDSSPKSADFAGVNKGYSPNANSGTDKFLNNACDEAYKKGYADLKPKTQAPSLIEDIKKFCSIAKSSTVFSLPEPASPASIGSSDYTTDKTLGHKTENQSLLINPKQANNQDWWEWVFDNRYPKDDSEKKAKLHDLFKNLDKAYEAISGDNTATTTVLNKACDQAYKKTSGDLGTKDQENSLISAVKQFCTQNKSDLTLPS